MAFMKLEKELIEENPVDAMNEIIVGLIEDNSRYRKHCLHSLALLQKVFILLANDSLARAHHLQTKEEDVQALLNDVKDLLTNAISKVPK